MYQIKWTRLQLQILRFLCIKAGQNFNLRAIAEILKVSPTAVSNALKGLDELVLVNKSKTMNLMSIGLNRNNQKAIEFKRTENLRLIYESGLTDFLYHEFPGCTIIVFGSYSKGYDIRAEEHHSDLDLAIIGTKEKKVDLTKFNRLLERTIIVNFYPSWQEIHKHLKESILGGIILNGGIEL